MFTFFAIGVQKLIFVQSIHSFKMWCKLFLLSCFFLNISAEIEVLTGNFFDNLKADPRLTGDLNVDTRMFLSEQIENYVNLIIGKRFSGRTKRDLPELPELISDETGSYHLKDVQPSATIPTKFPEDIALFQQNHSWFAAVLESPTIKETANRLIIYENMTSNSRTYFNEITRTPIQGGLKLSTIKIHDYTLIAVAENDTTPSDFEKKSAIFRFENHRLHKVQNIDMHFGSDVKMWRIHDNVFLSVSHYMDEINGSAAYETKFPIYQWHGQHFDVIQDIKGKGVKKVTPFNIGRGSFLALANFRDNNGNTKIYSDIYKFDHHTERYELYQRILTKACTDINFFSFWESPLEKDHFLIVANSYQTDQHGAINYETDSILYKFVENYFIPFQSFRLNGIQKWLPVQGPNNEFVLIASSLFDGLQFFQYDGWSFVEISQNFNFGKEYDLKSMRSYVINGVASLVVANKRSTGDTPNLFGLKFRHENALSEFRGEMINWCEVSSKIVEGLSGDDVLFLVGKPERADIVEDGIDPLTSTPTVSGSNVESREINSKIESINLLLSQIEQEAKETLRSTPQNKINGTLTANRIIFNNVVLFNDLNVEKLNLYNVTKLLQNKINPTSVQLDTLSLDSLEIAGELKVDRINGKNRTTLRHKTDEIVANYLNINGGLKASGVDVERIGGKIVNEQNVLLKDGDQLFSTNGQFVNLEVGNMSAGRFNGLTKEDLANLLKENRPKILIESIDNLKVKDLHLGGFINEVDIETLDKYTLKRKGDQIISASYTFESITGEDFTSPVLSGKKLSNLISTDNDLELKQKLILKGPVKINNLTVSKNLNYVQVTDGKLDVLFKDSPEKQVVTGSKNFDNLHILNPINIQAKIKSKELEKIIPLVTVGEDLIVKGDVIITGDVKIEDLLNAEDIVTADGAFSLTKLEREGLELVEREISGKLFFVQQINLHEVFTDQINGIDPRDFVVTGGNEIQTISGVKTFEGDVYITGPTNSYKINNVFVEELDGNVLRVDGDQVITGSHRVRHLIAQSISANHTKLENIGKSNATVIIDEPLNVETLKSAKITVKGSINGLNLNEIVADTVTEKTASNLVKGHKTVNNLTTDILTTPSAIDQLIDLKELKLNGPMTLQEIKARNIFFETNCNNLTRAEFAENETDEGGNQIIRGGNFTKIIVYGGAFIKSGRINEMSVRDLVEHTVKIDEPFEFEEATFGHVISQKAIILDGEVEKVDFDNVVLSDVDWEQIISDEKTFKSNLTIEGEVIFEGLVNGLNLSSFCNFDFGLGTTPKNFTINGNAYFSKPPVVSTINNIPIKHIMENVWFNNKDIVLGGSAEFEDVIFNNNLQVEGFVGDVKLKQIDQNYFSKSKDQLITSTVDFERIIFEVNVSAPNVTVSGKVNDVSIEDFVRTALLDDYDQVFEQGVYLEHCEIETLSGDFLVNGYNLASDVMRHDKTNMVTGKKRFDNLDAGVLRIEKNIKVQDVDVVGWIKSSVLKNGMFNITGTKTLNNTKFTEGLSIDGTLNGLNFTSDNVMLRNVPQNISGRKILKQAHFKGVKLRGMLNNVSIPFLIKNQAYKNKPNTFTTPINFHANVTAKNLVLKKAYNGVNITDLISNVTNLGAMNSLTENFDELLKMSLILKESLKEQAYFLHHYKIIQTIPHVADSFIFTDPDGVAKIGSIVKNNSTTVMNWHQWQPDSQIFLTEEFFTYLPKNLNYVDQVLMAHYIYMEDDSGNGHFLPLKNGMELKIRNVNNTKYTTSFALPHLDAVCSLFVRWGGYCDILCKRGNRIQLIQTLGIADAEIATTSTIGGTVFLVIASNQSALSEDASVSIWRFNPQTFRFEAHQLIFTAKPKGITTITYKDRTFLAIALGHLKNTKYSGGVELRLFNKFNGKFEFWDSLKLNAPIQVDFSILPSHELVLYVLTDNPTEPLIVFRYEGIAGFKEKVLASTLPKLRYLNQFVGVANEHFIITQSNDEINIIKAVFKGGKVVDG